MSIKIIGAILVIVGCGTVGFMIAAAFRREEQTLKKLICALDYMACELQYKLPSLPQLCRQTAAECDRLLCEVFLSLAKELEDQISPDVNRCMQAVISKQRDIPPRTKQMLSLLGSTMGRFDLEGQLKSLDAVRRECRRELETFTDAKKANNRSYQTLGLCAGAALAILFI